MRSTACDPPRHLRIQGAIPHPGRAVCYLLFGGALLLAARLVTISDEVLGVQLEQAQEDEQLIYAPPTTFLQIVALGYDHVIADALWFRTINYFGKHYRSDRTYPWLAHMCDRVTDLDPRAAYVYRFAGFLLPWEANEADAGIEILEKGARNMPESWELRYMLGFSYFYFKDDLEASSRTLRDAMLLPDAPHYISQLLAVVDAAHRGPDGAIEFLSTVARGGGSPEMREAVQEQIRGLTLARDLAALQSVVTSYEKQQGQPPAGLDVLVAGGWLSAMPIEPYGGHYVLDAATGNVTTTSGRKPARLAVSEMRKSVLGAEAH